MAGNLVLWIVKLSHKLYTTSYEVKTLENLEHCLKSEQPSCRTLYNSVNEII